MVEFPFEARRYSLSKALRVDDPAGVTVLFLVLIRKGGCLDDAICHCLRRNDDPCDSISKLLRPQVRITVCSYIFRRKCSSKYPP